MGILTIAVFIVVGIGIQRFILDPRGFIQDGSLLICENSDRIFVLRDGIRHVLPQDLEFAQQLGFNLTRLVEVSCEQLNEFPEGESVEEMLVSEEGTMQLAKVI